MLLATGAAAGAANELHTAIDLEEGRTVGVDPLDRRGLLPGRSPRAGIGVDTGRAEHVFHGSHERESRDRPHVVPDRGAVGGMIDDVRVHRVVAKRAIPRLREALGTGRLLEHVVEEDVRMRIDVGGKVSGPVGRGTQSGSSVDVYRTGVDRTGSCGRFAGVEGVADLGAGGIRGDRNVERFVEEAAIDAEPGVGHHTQHARDIRGARCRGGEIVLRDHNPRQRCQLRTDQEGRIRRGIVHGVDRQNVVSGHQQVEVVRQIDARKLYGVRDGPVRQRRRIPVRHPRGVADGHPRTVEVRHVPVLVGHIQGQIRVIQRIDNGKRHPDQHRGVDAEHVGLQIGLDQVGGAGIADQLQVEADVGTGGSSLMDFDGQYVLAFNEYTGRILVVLVEHRFGAAANDTRPSLIVDSAGRHVAAGDLLTVEVNHRAVVTLHVYRQVGKGPDVAHVKLVAEVSGDMLVAGVGPVTDDGCLVAVAVAELGRSEGPLAIVKIGPAPGRTLIRPVVEVAPARPLVDQRNVPVGDRQPEPQPRGAGVPRGVVKARLDPRRVERTGVPDEVLRGVALVHENVLALLVVEHAIGDVL